MAMSRKQILEALGGLSADDRADVVKWCDALGVQNLTRQDNESAEHAFQELSEQFAAYYHTPPISISVFARTRTSEYRRFLRAVDRTWQVIKSWWPETKRIARLALLRYLCRIAFSVCARRTRRVNWAHLITALQEIEATVNDAFPGWISAGIFQQRALAKVSGGLFWDEPNEHRKPIRSL